MVVLLVALLLQAPDDLSGFLEALEKDRAKGATNEELLQKLEKWAGGRPDGVLARVAWNRELLKTTIRLDALFAEGLRKRIGSPVTFGRVSGVVKEVKADRVVLGTTDVLFSSVPVETRLDDVKRQGLLPAKSPEEGILRFAAGKTVAALAAARTVAAGDDQNRVFAAIAGWAIQETERALAAGPVAKAAEDFAATWAKQPELLPPMRKFIDADLAPKLIAEVDALVETDRKAARKLLDLAASLCKGEETGAKISERKWAVLDKGEWMPVSLENVMYEGGELKGRAIAWEDPVKDAGKMRGLKITSIPVSWDEVSGVRARIKPTRTEKFDMRFQFEDELSIALVADLKGGHGYAVRFEKDREGEITKGSTRKLTKKGELELMAQWEDKKWKFSISGVEIDTMKLADRPEWFEFLTDNGAAELQTLQFRRR